MLQTVGNSLPPEMSYMILEDIAKLRKMPDLAKKIQEFKPQPDPMAQRQAELEIALLEAQVANETAKGRENEVDVGLKTAKTQTEQAKARNMNSDSDGKDLDFLEKESGVADVRDQKTAATAHEQDMEKREHDRLAKLDQEAFKGLAKQ